MAIVLHFQVMLHVHTFTLDLLSMPHPTHKKRRTGEVAISIGKQDFICPSHTTQLMRAEHSFSSVLDGTSRLAQPGLN